MSNLFNTGSFLLHSGQESDFKVDCDALCDQDFAALAKIIATSTRVRPFAWVEGVPRGGLQLAAELEPYCDSTSELGLIVDDVLTTGGSMKLHRAGRENVMGVVIFARCPFGDLPGWITPVWRFGL